MGAEGDRRSRVNPQKQLSWHCNARPMIIDMF